MPRPKTTDTEATRQAIADAAEALFRQVGYHKTTLADVAARLGMSPANIYRFFRSKLEINGAICDRLLAGFEVGWAETIDEAAPAAENLADFLAACHRHVREHFLANRGVYDMLDTAIEQNWPVMLKHVRRMTDFIEGMVLRGVRAGEFRECATAEVAPLFILAAHPFLDPRRIARTLADCEAQGAEEHMERDLRGIVTLLAQGLSPRLPPLPWPG